MNQFYPGRSLFLPKLVTSILALQNALSVFSFGGVYKPSSFQVKKELTLTAERFVILLEQLTVISQLPLQSL